MALKSNSSFLEKVVPILILALIGLAFAVGMLWQKVHNLEAGTSKGVGTTITNNQPQQPNLAVNIKDVDIKGEPFIGKEDAPVVIAYWLDYQCPYCKQFETDVLPTVLEKYVNTGKVKVVFKDLQFLGSDSQTAGLAEEAIWETAPQSFLKWHQAMYDKQDSENSGWGNKADIIALTRTIPGIDANKVSQLMDSKKAEYQKELDEDHAEAAKFGISGTPGFVIGKQAIPGAEPLNVFTQLIDAELAK